MNIIGKVIGWAFLIIDVVVCAIVIFLIGLLDELYPIVRAFASSFICIVITLILDFVCNRLPVNKRNDGEAGNKEAS